jgi:hypothetical protein
LPLHELSSRGSGCRCTCDSIQDFDYDFRFALTLSTWFALTVVLNHTKEPWARNNCPRMQTSTMCEECGETGHSANRCPIRPSFGRRSHKLQTSHLCPEHVCTLCNGEEEPKVQKTTLCPRAECRTCKTLFGHVAKDCANANCLGVNVDWFNSLAFFTDVSVTAQRSKQPASHRWHSPANHY